MPEPPAAYGPTRYETIAKNCSFWAKDAGTTNDTSAATMRGTSNSLPVFIGFLPFGLPLIKKFYHQTLRRKTGSAVVVAPMRALIGEWPYAQLPFRDLPEPGETMRLDDEKENDRP